MEATKRRLSDISPDARIAAKKARIGCFTEPCSASQPRTMVQDACEDGDVLRDALREATAGQVGEGSNGNGRPLTSESIQSIQARQDMKRRLAEAPGPPAKHARVDGGDVQWQALWIGVEDNKGDEDDKEDEDRRMREAEALEVQRKQYWEDKRAAFGKRRRDKEQQRREQIKNQGDQKREHEERQRREERRANEERERRDHEERERQERENRTWLAAEKQRLQSERQRLQEHRRLLEEEKKKLEEDKRRLEVGMLGMRLGVGWT